MPEQGFLYDPDDPLAEHSWTVPTGVTSVRLFVVGGGTWWAGSDDTGEASPPWRGLHAYAVPVTPGDDLTIVLGGASSDTEPGTNGGGAGGGGDRYDFPPGTELPRKWRGWGGGGATTIIRNGLPWVVAGGAGGAVEASFSSDSLTAIVRTDPGASPGADDDPRVPLPFIDPGYPFVTVNWTSGATGGVLAGAAGLLQDTAGSGGGGGGFGGGASGSVWEYNYDPTWPGSPFPENGLSPSPGRFGGFLVPDGVAYDDPWDPSSDQYGRYPAEAAGHGFVQIEWDPPASAGWHVGRIGMS